MTELWAIFSTDGKILCVATSEEKAHWMAEWLEDAPWVVLVDDGYTCRKIEVTPKEE